MLLKNLFPEWGEGETCKFDMLFCKRQSDDGNTKHNRPKKMVKSDPYPAYEEPEYIHKDSQTSCPHIFTFNIFSERPKT